MGDIDEVAEEIGDYLEQMEDLKIHARNCDNLTKWLKESNLSVAQIGEPQFGKRLGDQFELKTKHRFAELIRLIRSLPNDHTGEGCSELKSELTRCATMIDKYTYLPAFHRGEFQATFDELKPVVCNSNFLEEWIKELNNCDNEHVYDEHEIYRTFVRKWIDVNIEFQKEVKGFLTRLQMCENLSNVYLKECHIANFCSWVYWNQKNINDKKWNWESIINAISSNAECGPEWIVAKLDYVLEEFDSTNSNMVPFGHEHPEEILSQVRNIKK